MSGRKELPASLHLFKSTTINSRCLMLFKPRRPDDVYESFLEKL